MMDAVRVLVLVLVLLCPAIAIEVHVLPDLASDCSIPALNHSEAAMDNINTALEHPGSNTTLRLRDGCYLVNNFTLLQDLSDISLIGSGNGTTILKCQSDGEAGLAFINISGLVLSNLTITGCGLLANGANLQQAFNAINQSLDLFYILGVGTTVGIFIGDTSDLHLHNMIVQNTTGIGMVAINLMGASDMSNVTFRDNIPILCNFNMYNRTQPNIGGGLVVLYADYRDDETLVASPQLTISSSRFVSNSQCNPLVATLQFADQGTTQNNGIAFGGGLGLILSQVRYSVSITVASTVFESNISPFGAGASIISHEGVNDSYVTISGSIFRKNGISLDSFLQNRLYSTSGGLGITLNFEFPRHNSFLEDVVPSQIQPTSVTIENTTFEDNKAVRYAGMSITYYNSPLSTRNDVIVRSCQFFKNRSPSTAAFGAVSTAFSGYNPLINIVFENVIIIENDVSTFNVNQTLLAGATEQRAVVTVTSVNLIIKGKTKFLRNLGSALALVRSTIAIDGDVSFNRNEGSGIILLDTSYIVLKRNSNLSFIGNIATDTGGAILVELASSTTDYSLLSDCFLWFGEPSSTCLFDNSCQTITDLNATLIFENNQAPLGGTIYGSRLSTCPWAQPGNGSVIIPRSGIAILANFSSVTFNPPPTSASVVSTNPFLLYVENSLNPEPITAVPGKTVNLSMRVTDLFGQSVPSAINFISHNNTATDSRSSLGLSGYWFLPGLTPNPPVQATFYGEPGSEFSTLVAALDSYSRITLPVILESCSFGFNLSNDQECICNEDLPSDVNCNQQTFQLRVPPSFWLGNSPTGGIAYASCIFDYCDVGIKTISDGDIDSQCQPGFNRAGLMCAACQPNTSVVFGSNACHACSNDWLALIILFAVVGILLVIAISFLGFYISEGFVNSLLFYCNVTSFYASFFSPNRFNHIAFFMVRFVNLSLGFELCFYDGMDTLGKVAIQLLFPGYLFLIMVVIILLAKYSSKISNAGFSAAKTFSTLLLLCYTSVGETCVQILGVQTLSGTNGTYYGWYTDPTVQYGNGFHGFLVFVAVALILLYILPFSIALLLPPLILRTKLSIMLKPLLDAFWNPFKPTFRFWLGFRAILRIIPFLFAVFTPYPTNCFLLIIFIAILLVLHERCQPFEGKWQNILDEFFMFNLLLLSAGGVFFGLTTPNSGTHIAFVSILLILAYFAFLVIITVHIDSRFPIIRKTVMNFYKKIKSKLNERKDVKDTETLDDDDDGYTAPILLKIDSNTRKQNGSKPKPTTYSELREPILEYGEGDYM